MAIFDFLKIYDVNVGSKIICGGNEINSIEEISFGDFVFQYLRDLETYAEVHNKLWLELTENYRNQKSCDKKDLSKLLQERGMLINSIKLIERNYGGFL